MALTDIQAVRLKTSDKSTISREKATGNAVDKFYKLDHAPVNSAPAIQVRKDDVLLTVTTDYTIDLEHGIVTMVTIPAVNAVLEFTYYWSVFSDEEVDYFISESGSNITIASAHLLLAWAADAAKLAKRQTLSGGGGLGQVVIDTSVAAKELRATAANLIKTEQELGESIPADGLTEIPWTEASYKQQLDQHTVRNH